MKPKYKVNRKELLTWLNEQEYREDAVKFAEQKLGYTLDEWQKDVLHSKSKKKVFNCARQSGKSTIAAIKALHRAYYFSGSLIILLSPSQRQSSELFRKVADIATKLTPPLELVEDNKLSLTLTNGSRIVSLPSNERTIRGYSAVNLVVEDEAAAVPDDIYTAVRPMLAVSNGEYNMLSTPRGKQGHFYEAWMSDEWEQVCFTADMNPRISKEFLDGERKELGSRMFAQEYECEFLEDQEGSIFKRDWFKFVDSFPRDARFVRRWDRAATEATQGKDPDWTAGCLMGMKDGQFWIVDMKHDRRSPKGNEDLIRQTALEDTARTLIRMEQEPGSSGKDVIDHYQRQVLVGYDFKGVPSTGSKIERAGPFSAACEAGNVFIVRGSWNQAFLDELCAFPNPKLHDDQVDATTGAFLDLTNKANSSNSNRFAIVASR